MKWKIKEDWEEEEEEEHDDWMMMAYLVGRYRGKEKLVVVPIIPASASWLSSDLLISILHTEVKFKALRWCDVTPGGVQSASFFIFCFSRYADNEK
jgi:hypothetical protein